MQTDARPANRLIHETSPYLRQHAHNPVDWYPWGPEALERARREEKPIFLSIGYSACHWCHVMEHESFEDPQTAAVMNSHFINIKVDREERPDLDHIYMSAVQMMTQHGGWPMSVFLTPALEPFYGGTYFPPADRMGMPSFTRILTGVSEAWNTRREEVNQSAQQLSQALINLNRGDDDSAAGSGTPSLDITENAVEKYAQNFDSANGGFGTSPKFFHSMDLRVCLRHARRTRSEKSLKMVTVTLDKISRGGIYDHLGGGFHRYSTDSKWLVPHFEKMLYDNALLAELFLETYRLTDEKNYRDVATETLDYVLREMTSANGPFFSTQDADSEGVEGKFYVWTKSEIETVLGDRAATFCRAFDVTDSGNWEGQTILNLTQSLGDADSELRTELKASKAKLLAVRARRIAPHTDEKVLVSWNAMMIHSLALGYQVTQDSRYLDAAVKAASFLERNLWSTRDGKLLHVYKDGVAKLDAYLDDYALLIQALVTLFESDFNEHWLALAENLAEKMVALFWDDAGRTFYFTATDHERLIVRPKEVYDGATPSGTSMATTALIRLGQILGTLNTPRPRNARLREVAV